MWPFPDELDSWFKRVEEERKKKFNIDVDTDDSSGGGMMAENELTKGLK